MELRHRLVLVAGLALGVGSLAIARSSPGARSAVARSPRAWSSWAPAGRWSPAGRSYGRAGPRAASECCSSPPGARGSPSSSTTRVWARRGVHARAADLGRVPRAGGARGARLPGRPAVAARRRGRAGDRLHRHAARAGTVPGAGLRPRRAGLLAMSTQSRRGRERARPHRVWLERAGLLLGLAWAPAVVALAVWRVVRSTSAARLLAAPVLLAASLYLALVAGGYAHSLRRGFLSNDEIDQWLWLGQTLALVAVALGVVLAWARGRRARMAVARLVIELSDTPEPGTLRDLLARALDDRELSVAYPLAHGLAVDGMPPDRAAGDGGARGDPTRARRIAGRPSHPPSRAARRSGTARGRGCRGRPRARPRTLAGGDARAARSSSGCRGADRRGRRQCAPPARARPARRRTATARGALARAAAAPGGARRRPRASPRRGRGGAARRTRRTARARPRDLPSRAGRRRARHRDRGARRSWTGAAHDRIRCPTSDAWRRGGRRVLPRGGSRQAEQPQAGHRRTVARTDDCTSRSRARPACDEPRRHRGPDRRARRHAHGRARPPGHATVRAELPCGS